MIFLASNLALRDVAELGTDPTAPVYGPDIGKIDFFPENADSAMDFLPRLSMITIMINIENNLCCRCVTNVRCVWAVSCDVILFGTG